MWKILTELQIIPFCNKWHTTKFYRLRIGKYGICISIGKTDFGILLEYKDSI